MTVGSTEYRGSRRGPKQRLHHRLGPVGEAEGDLSPSPEQSDNAMSRTKEVVLVIKLQTPIYG